MSRPDPACPRPARNGWSAITLLIVLGTGTAAGAAEPSDGPRLERDAVTAKGRQATLVTVPRFGRYALSVHSGEGVALRLVDRMAGPGEVQGEPGKSDGRIDAFLERGEYRLLSEGHRLASGDARLEIHSFTERHGPKAPVLVEHKLVQEELRDFEQASYWLEVKERRTVVLEAAGRSLADLRLWLHGTWLEAAQPTRDVVEAVVGKPLAVCHLTAKLEPGLYLLTAYGGPPRPWAEDDGGQPLYLRAGIPRLPMAGRRKLELSPFGVDRYLVPAPANYFRMELPEALTAKLGVGDFDEDDPFGTAGQEAEITKKSVPPATELRHEAAGDGARIVTVSGSQGQPFILQHFELRDSYPFSGTGAYWVGSIHSGHAADSVGVSAILVKSRLPEDPPHIEPLRSETVELDARSGWARRANLLDLTTLFIHVKETSSYEVKVADLPVEIRVEPFLVGWPQGVAPPPPQASPARYDLDPGYYTVTILPRRKGVSGIVIRPRGLIDAVLDRIGLGQGPPPSPVQAAATFPTVQLDRRRSYTLFLNRQPGVEAGAVLRRLPLDLKEGLPLALKPGEEVSLPFEAKESGTLRAVSEEGAPLELSVDQGAHAQAFSVTPGRHTVSVRNGDTTTRIASLALTPRHLEAGTPLPDLPDQALASLPHFPNLTHDAPLYADLDRRASTTFVVQADAPGLYRLETTGLLATSGTLRTRAQPQIDKASMNGVGRNFALDTYLREGQYQTTVTTEGDSSGHLGMRLARSEPTKGGFITSRVPARASLASGEAIEYSFIITTPGRFRVYAQGLGRSFRCRLEDRQGWPLVTPGGTADLTMDFEPGRYRLVVLPEVTPARVVTSIAPVGQAPPKSGHGPHRLSLGRRVAHVWVEPNEGDPRDPDVFEVDIPAPLHATIELGGGMLGRLISHAEPAMAPLSIEGAKGWKGALASGRYQFEIVSERPNNRAPYELGIFPEELVAGLSRPVTAPAELPLSIGEEGLYEASTFGASDVKASLLDHDGRLIAQNDDRTDDWNAQVTAVLGPGDYLLRIDPVGTVTAVSTVSLRRLAEKEEGPVTLPASIAVTPGRLTRLYPLPHPSAPGLLVASLKSRDAMGLALEYQTDDGWRTAATGTGRNSHLEVPLDPTATATRLRVWSLDGRDAEARLGVAWTAGPQADEKRLARGLPMAAVPGAGSVVAAVVALDRPGVFSTQDAESPLRFCAEPMRACTPAFRGSVIAPTTTLWVVADSAATARVTRVRMRPGADLSLALRADSVAQIDLDRADGPVLLCARSSSGPVALALGARNHIERTARAMTTLGTGITCAAAFDRSADSALAWAAAGPVEDLRLTLTGFGKASSSSLVGGVEAGILGVVARDFTMPRGTKRVRLALGQAIVAVLSDDGVVASVHGVGDGSYAELTETRAQRLTVLHLREAEDHFTLEVLPIPSDRPVAIDSADGLFETDVDRSGWFRVPVSAGAPSTPLQVRGAGGDAVLVASDGRVTKGSDLVVSGGGGTLLVPCSPGRLLIQRGDGTRGAALDETATVAVRPPTAVPLEGASRILKIATRGPRVVHLRVAQPLATVLRRPGHGPEASLHQAGTRLDFHLDQGEALVYLRPLAGDSLHSIAEVTTSDVVGIDEGLGPEVLLAPGGARFFSFTVTRQGPVGLAVQADSDRVEATLLSTEGALLARGNLMMPELGPGTYLLALQAPPDAAPIQARAAVAGLRPPPNDPPMDVVRTYLTAPEAGTTAGETSFTATHVAEAPAGFEGERESDVAEGEEEGAEAQEAGDEPTTDAETP